MWTIHKAELCKLPQPKKDRSKGNGECNSDNNIWKLAYTLADIQSNEGSTVE